MRAHNDVVTIDGGVCNYVIFHLDHPQLEQPFRTRGRKGSTSSQCWTHGNTGHGQRIRVFPNGALGFHVVGKEFSCPGPVFRKFLASEFQQDAVEAFKEIMELTGGSIFLNLRQSQNTSSRFSIQAQMDYIRDCPKCTSN
ncbi:hypothetical protein AV530_016571 [Patagioenas fasciata monilis]|uniref:Uncharacterized protein n=1 Tax=Patagioenas fasciata monilis TaxID=372326 RepID=A0A1V4J2Q4_PATFA|nr:hypothetical protein AV530_016571 [Patagioenas fasciata monilis]